MEYSYICSAFPISQKNTSQLFWGSYVISLAYVSAWLVAFLGAYGFDSQMWRLAMDQATYTWFHIAFFPPMCGLFVVTTFGRGISVAQAVILVVCVAAGFGYAIVESVSSPVVSQYMLRTPKFSNTVPANAGTHAVRVEKTNVQSDQINGMPIANIATTGLLLTLVGSWIGNLCVKAWHLFFAQRIANRPADGCGEVCAKLHCIPDILLTNFAMLWVLLRVYANWAEGVSSTTSAAAYETIPLVIFTIGSCVVLSLLATLLFADLVLKPYNPNIGGQPGASLQDAAKFAKYVFGIPTATLAILGVANVGWVISVFRFYFSIYQKPLVPAVLILSMYAISIIVAVLFASVVWSMFLSVPLRCGDLTDDLMNRLIDHFKIKMYGNAQAARAHSDCVVSFWHLVESTKSELLAASFSVTDVNDIQGMLVRRGLTFRT